MAETAAGFRGSLGWRPTAARIRWTTGLVAAAAIWEALPRLGVVPGIILPPPSAIVAAAMKDFGSFMANMQITVLEALVATAIAWALGVTLGVIFGSLRRVARFLVPLLDSAFALPWVVLYPLAVVWLGIGSPSKVVFAVVTGVFPILLTTTAAVSTIDERYVLLSRSLGATRRQLFLKILLPFALPQIISGLRVGTGLVVIGVVVGEMLASVGGLGYMISYYRATFESGHVYFAIVLTLFIAWVSNALLERVERYFARWKEAS